MATVLILSSYVAAGAVGLSAASPVLTALGCEVIGVPTIVLSNHKAWPAVAGEPVAASQIDAMVHAIEANGWLQSVDAVLIGYTPNVAVARSAASAIERTRRVRPSVNVICDPVLGDDPKGLYQPRDVAEVVRDALLPLADVITPNRFELEWLVGAPIATRIDAVDQGRRLLERNGLGRVLVTSPPNDEGAPLPDETGVMEISATSAHVFSHPMRAGAPKGVGDVFAGLIAAGVETGAALGLLRALIDASADQSHLAVGRVELWRDAASVAGRAVRRSDRTSSRARAKNGDAH